jgi:N-acetylglucosamine-6-phosphate deacetylase
VIVLSGADLVLPDRVLSPGTLVIEGDRISDIVPGGAALYGHVVVPGLIDVHVHGVQGVDAFDEDGVASMAARLPAYGVTAFCPTTIACAPDVLARVLSQVRRARESPAPDSARVLPAHLESNFISPDFKGAHPGRCLRRPGLAGRAALGGVGGSSDEFGADDVLREVERGGPDVGIVTLAPELDGGLELIAWLTRRGCRVSIGHSGASYEQALDAIAAGAGQATHLFNAMPPLHHRSPGLAGAVLQAADVTAELICDGFHVHPAMARTAMAVKGPARIMAVSDGTSAAGLPVGVTPTLGGQPITAGAAAAFLSDGTVAGSVVTLDQVLRTLVGLMAVPLTDAVTMCAATPARELGLAGQGRLAAGALADLAVLDSRLSVVETYVGGRLVYSRKTGTRQSV